MDSRNHKIIVVNDGEFFTVVHVAEFKETSWPNDGLWYRKVIKRMGLYITEEEAESAGKKWAISCGAEFQKKKDVFLL